MPAMSAEVIIGRNQRLASRARPSGWVQSFRHNGYPGTWVRPRAGPHAANDSFSLGWNIHRAHPSRTFTVRPSDLRAPVFHQPCYLSITSAGRLPAPRREAPATETTAGRGTGRKSVPRVGCDKRARRTERSPVLRPGLRTLVGRLWGSRPGGPRHHARCADDLRPIPRRDQRSSSERVIC